MKFSPALAALLAQATNKKEWATVLLNALDDGLTFKCKRDSDIAAEDPFATGTLFFAASLTGSPRISSNNVVSLGRSHTVTTKLAADLSTGKSVLRIEAGEHWIEGSLGLLTSTCDFRVRQNPTNSTGISLKNISIAPRRDLPTGIGPTAPDITADTTMSIQIEDMRYPAIPFLVGTIYLDAQRDHLVFEDEELATEMGDIRITQTENTVVFGNFEFGATRFDMNKALNSEADAPVEQGVVYCKPYNVWPTYPFMDSWRLTRDLTYPKPFRVKLLRADGSVKKILQMRDGLPINDPSLQWEGFFEGGKSMRPHWNCAMMLPWQSHLPKVSSNFGKFFNGMEPDSIRESQAKQGVSANAAIPLASRTNQWNSQLHWNAAPQWPIPFDGKWGGTPEYNAMNTFDDPFLFDTTRWHGGEGMRMNLSGWDYEPASISQHDHLAMLGGPRHDRACVPHVVAMFASNPSGVRLKGAVPYRRLIDAYGFGMFNLHHHYVMDIKRCTGIPIELVLGGEINYTNGRYTGGLDSVPMGEKRIVDLHGIKSGEGWPTRQRDEHHQWAGWQQDHLHNSLSPNLWTILFNSPMHLISGTMRYAGSVMCQPSGAGRPTTNARNYWLEREGAWRWLQYCIQWKAATQHFLGIKRADIEKNFQTELERVYDDIYVPTKITNNPLPYFEGLRCLGMHAVLESDPAPKPDAIDPPTRWKYLSPGHDTKTFYYAHMLVMMRQFGLWKTMRAKSEKCRLTLDFLIECLDKFGIEAMYHTEGRCSVNTNLALRVPFDGPDPAFPANWEEWNLTVFPKEGQKDMVTRADGVVSTDPLDEFTQAATAHLRSQYVLMRPIYFPEHAHPLLTAASDLVKALYAKHTAYVLGNNPSPGTQRDRDWTSRWAGHGVLKAPTVLESAEL